MSGITKDKRYAILDSVGGRYGPDPTQLASWLRSLPQDLSPGAIASVLERADSQRLGVSRVFRGPTGPGSSPGHGLDKSSGSAKSESDNSLDGKRYRSDFFYPGTNRGRFERPQNPSVAQYTREGVDPPETLLRSIDRGEERPGAEKATSRQAIILERISSMESVGQEEIWTTLKDIGLRTYGHEQGPLLAELINRYPIMVTDFRFLFGENRVLIRKNSDEIAATLPEVQRCVEGRSAKPVYGSVLRGKKIPSGVETVSMEVNLLTLPMVQEAIDLAPTAIAIGVSEDKAPRGAIFNMQQERVDVSVLFKVDDEFDDLDDLLDPMDPENERRQTDYSAVVEEFSAKAERIQEVGFYNPHPGHKLVSQLVYLDDQDRARELIGKSRSSKIRQLELVYRKDPTTRGPFSISTVGGYSYLLYKDVEIICLLTKTLEGQHPGRKKASDPVIGSDGIPRYKKKPLSGNQAKKKRWIDKHRSYCQSGCAHCGKG